MSDVEREKRGAGEAAAALVEDDMLVGLGTGSTVAYVIDALSRRHLQARYVATSLRTRDVARARGLVVEDFNRAPRLDLAIDGADQVAASGWLVKGGGGAHTREKIVAASADRFVVIVDASKLVEDLHGPVPVEVSAFGLASTLERLRHAVVRDTALSPDGGVIADYACDRVDPENLAQHLGATPGVISHGLFAPVLVSEVIVGEGKTVRWIVKGEST